MAWRLKKPAFFGLGVFNLLLGIQCLMKFSWMCVNYFMIKHSKAISGESPGDTVPVVYGA
ncbi:hypothetical protein [Saccharophagus degradans]|uniref:Uncharacterized protein n=1 Tax=Saccharophagus degradans TaxID=86304 RepID=A0AAW7X1Q0_9GAMM|nr:hypothetical protein [Saccharophagus degradans]MDO6420862.1 hypothetical protein [Saccharophagus degradans]MDO6609711.1 hypothetical protein [Saccharophagus degradans]